MCVHRRRTCQGAISPPDRSGAWRPVLFCSLVWIFLFAGAAPTAAINGIALAAAPPDAATYASGIQFSVQNGAKLLVPLVGGAVIDGVGLLPGFDSVDRLSAGTPE